MERNEMIEVLMAKVNISSEEAQEALEKCNWDLLDTIIYLERRKKEENNETTAIVPVPVKEEKKDDGRHEEKFAGVGDIIGRMFKFVGKVIKKANETFFEARKENEKPIRVSLLILAFLLIFLSVPSIVVLILGLFSGYKYSISGKNINKGGINDIFDGVSKSAETIKKDFKEACEK